MAGHGAPDQEPIDCSDLRVAVVAASWHTQVMDGLLAGAPRSFAILNGTLAASIGLGLRLWIAGALIWLFGHAVAVWVTRKDPAFLTVLSRHARHKGALAC